MAEFIVNFLISIAVISFPLLAYVVYKFWQLIKPLSALPIDENEYWGNNDERNDDDKSVRPFRIDFGGPEAMCELQAQLIGDAINKMHPPLEGTITTKRDYGVNSTEFKSFVEYWRCDYLARWPEREALFNSVPHFKTTIQG